MKFRLSWLLSIFIYLSVSGNLFAVPVHLCPSMAAKYISALSTSNTLKIHEHQLQTSQSMENHHSTSIKQHALQTQNDTNMESCSCVDCDCTTSHIVQITTSLITNVDLITFIPSHGSVFSKGALNFISQPQTNPLRPPIFT
ncbi:MAG: hypothetical protein COB83_02980 [Gammaproteobacteria bacterium]|nr:MAG: hypothetical protein COB83_02980 [Gammaproteobacteria bacterium]